MKVNFPEDLYIIHEFMCKMRKMSNRIFIFNSMFIRMFHLSKLQSYRQKLCSTHRHMNLCGGISQIDGLKAGKITYDDHSLLVVRKFVNTTFDQQIRC